MQLHKSRECKASQAIFKHVPKFTTACAHPGGDLGQQFLGDGVGDRFDEAIEQGRLRRLLAPYRLRESALYAMYPSRHYLDAKVRTWIDYLKEQLPALFEGHARVVDDARYWR